MGMKVGIVMWDHFNTPLHVVEIPDVDVRTLILQKFLLDMTKDIFFSSSYGKVSYDVL